MEEEHSRRWSIQTPSVSPVPDLDSEDAFQLLGQEEMEQPSLTLANMGRQPIVRNLIDFDACDQTHDWGCSTCESRRKRLEALELENEALRRRLLETQMAPAQMQERLQTPRGTHVEEEDGSTIQEETAATEYGEDSDDEEAATTKELARVKQMHRRMHTRGMSMPKDIDVAQARSQLQWVRSSSATTGALSGFIAAWTLSALRLGTPTLALASLPFWAAVVCRGPSPERPLALADIQDNSEGAVGEALQAQATARPDLVLQGL